jgi:hypothetical protein
LFTKAEEKKVQIHLPTGWVLLQMLFLLGLEDIWDYILLISSRSNHFN